MTFQPADGARVDEDPIPTLRVEQDLPVYRGEKVHFRVPDADGRVMVLTLDFVCCTEGVSDELGYRETPSWEVRDALVPGWKWCFRLLG